MDKKVRTERIIEQLEIWKSFITVHKGWGAEDEGAFNALLSLLIRQEDGWQHFSRICGACGKKILKNHTCIFKITAYHPTCAPEDKNKEKD